MISNKELISLVRDDVVKVAKKMNKEATYPSTTIALILWLHHEAKTTEDDIMASNNPLGILASDNSIRSFNSIEECLIVGDGYDLETEDFKSKKKDICKTNKLYGIDKLYIVNQESNEIDLTDQQRTPKVDNYQIKKDNEVIMKTDSIEDALKSAEENNATIINSKGAVVDGGMKVYQAQNAISYSLAAGTAIHCKLVNLYGGYRSQTPLRLISGTYYLYDGINYADKFAICATPELALTDTSKIIGFVRRSDITIK